MTDVYGGLVSRGDVGRAVLDVLAAPPVGSRFPLLAYYLAERERRRNLKPRTLPLPPAASSYRQSLDFEPYAQDRSPTVIAVVQPTGRPERKEDSTYGQWFDVQVGAVVMAADEDASLDLADEYGVAIMAVIAQHGSLGGFAQRSVLTGEPETLFFDQTKRRLMRSVVTFQTYVEQTVGERFGSTHLTPDPYASPAPLSVVGTVDVTLKTER